MLTLSFSLLPWISLSQGPRAGTNPPGFERVQIALERGFHARGAISGEIVQPCPRDVAACRQVLEVETRLMTRQLLAVVDQVLR
jgi:hypothetical protein